MQSYTERGLFLFVYGADSLADFLHADNFVQAHIKVAKTLLGEDPITVCGENKWQHFHFGKCESESKEGVYY